MGVRLTFATAVTAMDIALIVANQTTAPLPFRATIIGIDIRVLRRSKRSGKHPSRICDTLAGAWPGTSSALVAFRPAIATACG